MSEKDAIVFLRKYFSDEQRELLKKLLAGSPEYVRNNDSTLGVEVRNELRKHGFRFGIRKMKNWGAWLQVAVSLSENEFQQFLVKPVNKRVKPANKQKNKKLSEVLKSILETRKLSRRKNLEIESELQLFKTNPKLYDDELAKLRKFLLSYARSKKLEEALTKLEKRSNVHERPKVLGCVRSHLDIPRLEQWDISIYGKTKTLSQFMDFLKMKEIPYESFRNKVIVNWPDKALEKMLEDSPIHLVWYRPLDEWTETIIMCCEINPEESMGGYYKGAYNLFYNINLLSVKYLNMSSRKTLTLSSVIDYVINSLIVNLETWLLGCGSESAQNELRFVLSQKWQEIFAKLFFGFNFGKNDRLTEEELRECAVFERKTPEELSDEILNFVESPAQWKIIFHYNWRNLLGYSLKKGYWLEKYPEIEKFTEKHWKRWAAIILSLEKVPELRDKIFDDLADFLKEWAEENGERLNYKNIKMVLESLGIPRQSKSFIQSLHHTAH